MQCKILPKACKSRRTKRGDKDTGDEKGDFAQMAVTSKILRATIKENPKILLRRKKTAMVSEIDNELSKVNYEDLSH